MLFYWCYKTLTAIKLDSVPAVFQPRFEPCSVRDYYSNRFENIQSFMQLVRSVKKFKLSALYSPALMLIIRSEPDPE